MLVRVAAEDVDRPVVERSLSGHERQPSVADRGRREERHPRGDFVLRQEPDSPPGGIPDIGSENSCNRRSGWCLSASM